MGGADEGAAARNCYVNILRDSMTVDQLDPCGIYFGTTGGQVYGSANGGDSWTPSSGTCRRYCPLKCRRWPDRS